MTTDNARAQLIGSWELVSFTSRLPDGRIVQPWGAKPVGRITYDATGNMVALLMHELRNEAQGQSSPDSLQAQYSAYFGAFEVDTIRRLVIHRVNGSLSASRASGELRRSYELRDGRLVLSFTRPAAGGEITQTLTWRRIDR